jgi:hypothetical protein
MDYRNLAAFTGACITLLFATGFISYSHGAVNSTNNASGILYPLNSQPFEIGYIKGAEGFHKLIYGDLVIQIL